MPGSCSSGLRSRPSAAAGTSRTNGFDVNSMNSRKPTPTRPITASTRASIARGQVARAQRHRAAPSPASISTHSSSEPSCEPHVAAKRYGSGSCEFECCATFSTEKSFVDEAPREAAERERDEHELRARGGRGERHQRGVAAVRAPTSGSDALRERDEQREDQREMAELGNHRCASFSVGIVDRLVLVRLLRARRAASGGM